MDRPTPSLAPQTPPLNDRFDAAVFDLDGTLVDSAAELVWSVARTR